MEISHCVGKLTEAEKCFEKCLRIREEKLGMKSSRVGQTLKHMLSFYEEQGNQEFSTNFPQYPYRQPN
jgi:hypothetical protein